MRAAIALAFALFACQRAGAESPVDFERDIRPLFAGRCFKCHGASHPEADLDLTSRASPLALGVILPHDVAGSSLIERVASTDPSVRMPPEGVGLSTTEIETLKRWIAEGADWPAHWAWRPLKKPPIPAVDSPALRSWARTPIDLFIARELERRALTPSNDADARTLSRRLAFDLLGMPLLAETGGAEIEGEAIGGEQRRQSVGISEDDYERTVDRLLASPHFGERFARGWMDVVHFAETHGHDQDRPREHAWPYRDYLIRSFNGDKDYSRFVQEQVAGDVLFADEAEAILGTGLLAAGPWDESSLRDIREDSIDREIGRYLDRDDIVSTVMQTFTSASVHCARCHDHKFDPISQNDYYALQAVFSGIDKANRPYDADPAIASERRRLAAEKQRIADLLAVHSEELLSPDNRALMLAWEDKIARETVHWRTLETLEISAERGSLFQLLPDGSILAVGERPDADTYHLRGKTSLPRVSALRIDLLVDDSLPHKGPGRQENGNLHLNELIVFQQTPSDQSPGRRLQLTDPRADFNQEGWSIEAAIDGNVDRAWGIHPEIGKPHHATFALVEPVIAPAGVGEDAGALSFQIQLQQVHGRGHLIGRFRVSVADTPLPMPPDELTLPGEIQTIVAVDPLARTTQQLATLSAYVQTTALDARLAQLPPPSLVYSGTPTFQPDGSFKPSPQPRVVNVLNRGQVSEPLREASPGALTCLEGFAADFPTTAAGDEPRRAALARWLADPRNGLTWRSIANRVWQHHFGRGLAETANDFGRMGSAPSHPELLDWLATYLLEHGGSLKALHRLIVTSSVYRQSSAHRAESAARDQNNVFLWRMNRRRLDAESFHDALLAVSGTLDSQMGGPSVRQFIQTPGVHVTPNVDYLGFSSDDPANYRRSVYRFLFRTLPDPLMDALDCPDASQLTPQRTESLTALQSLATLNDKFVVRQSELLAERIADHQTSEQQVISLFALLFDRPPSAAEATAVAGYAKEHGWANACRILLNTNEFLFVD